MAEAPRLTIDLGALRNNYRLFRSMTGAEVGGVVKANAYGTGMAQAVPALTAEGCRQFFVATLDEALALRKIDAGVSVAVLGGLAKGAEEEYLAHGILPVLNALEMIGRWRDLARKKDRVLPALIHFDTGMHRLGLGPDETETLLGDRACLEGLETTMVLSHFACADEKDHPMNGRQAADFAALAARFPHAVASLCNSAGLFRDKAWHHGLIRPGIALYGGNPTPETANPVLPVVTLDVPVLQVRTVKKGRSIGYAAGHVFDKDTVTATLGFGYADGYIRAAGGKSFVYWQGKACPVVGRVSMDLVTVDLGGLRGPLPVPGDTMTALGAEYTVDDLAKAAGTISYEILTALGARYRRIYKS